MLLETWGEVVTRAVQDIGASFIVYMPNIFLAIVIFIFGWMVGAILSRVVGQVIKAIKVDNALREAGLEEVFSKAGLKLDSGRFLGGLVKWFIVIIFLVISLEILALDQVTAFLQDVILLYLPNVIAAVLILLIAAVIAEFMQKVVTGSAKAADLPSARFLGSVTRWSIWVFAILAALAQLNIATAFVQTLFTGIVIAVSLALGLAFGLGGQEAAARYLEHLRHEMPHHDPDDDDEDERKLHHKKKKKKHQDDDHDEDDDD